MVKVEDLNAGTLRYNFAGGLEFRVIKGLLDQVFRSLYEAPPKRKNPKTETPKAEILDALYSMPKPS